MLRRMLMVAFLVLATSVSARAQSVDLSEAALADACFRIELSLDLTGKIAVQQEGKPLTFGHAAQAKHQYLERVLDAANGVAERTARHYNVAEGIITFDGKPTKRSLSSKLGIFVAHHIKDGLVVYSPKHHLSRAEAEMTEHFNTLAISGLVPNKQVSVGDSWKLSNAIALLLCDLDGLTDHDITCKLESVQGELARVSVVGKASGIDMGAQVKMLVQSSFLFHTQKKRVVRVDWKQSDQRDQGPVSPAMSADITIVAERTPIDEPTELSKFALVPIPPGSTPPTSLAHLLYRDPKSRFELQHGREWHAVSPEGQDQLVLRLMDRGDFVAQATVTPWKSVDPKSLPSLEEFREKLADVPGWSEEAVLEKTKVESSQGYTVYRITATGMLDKIKAVQSFYLVASPRGEQVVVTFSMTPSQVQKLETRDVTLVRSLTFAGDTRDSEIRPVSNP